METLKSVVVGDSAVGKSSLLFTLIIGSCPSEDIPRIFDETPYNCYFNGKPISLGIWYTGKHEVVYSTCISGKMWDCCSLVLSRLAQIWFNGPFSASATELVQANMQ